jgi:hypothetical protein
MKMILIQSVGSIGAICLFLAYAKRHQLSEANYSLLNMAGALLVAGSSACLYAFAPTVLNVFWFFVALSDFRKADRSKSD